MVIDDGGGGSGTTLDCLKGLLLALVAGKDDNRSQVQTIEGSGHDVECGCRD